MLGGDPEPELRGGVVRLMLVGLMLVDSGGDAGGVRLGSGRPEPAGPGVGLRPSRKALAMSAAFHLAYRIFSSFLREVSIRLGV